MSFTIRFTLRYKTMKTYDIYFKDQASSIAKGFKMPLNQALDYIADNNGTGYFADYKGGTVSIVCNETGLTAYETEVKEMSGDVDWRKNVIEMKRPIYLNYSVVFTPEYTIEDLVREYGLEDAEIVQMFQEDKVYEYYQYMIIFKMS